MFLRHLIIHSHYSPLNSNCSIALLKDSVQKQACDSRQDFTKAWKSENFSTAVSGYCLYIPVQYFSLSQYWLLLSLHTTMAPKFSAKEFLPT